jgi:hypothetical protein
MDLAFFVNGTMIQIDGGQDKRFRAADPGSQSSRSWFFWPSMTAPQLLP